MKPFLWISFHALLLVGGLVAIGSNVATFDMPSISLPWGHKTPFAAEDLTVVNVVDPNVIESPGVKKYLHGGATDSYVKSHDAIFRTFPPNADMSKEPKFLQDAYQAVVASDIPLPAMGVSNGRDGDVFAIPEDGTGLDLVKKYGGK